MKKLLSIIFLVTISLNVSAKDFKKNLHAVKKNNHHKTQPLPNKKTLPLHKASKQNYKEDYQHFQTATKLNNNVLEKELEEGLHAAQEGNYKSAIPLLNKAAQQNNSMAHVVLGLMYKNGKGIKQNQKTAFQHFLTAAKLNDADGQFNVAQMYEYGKGVAKDDTEAVKWYQLSADQGLTDAQLRIGLLYQYGQNGVTQDYKLAQKWFRLAAQQGDPDAQLLLGLAYLNGNGLPKDLIRAYAWTYLAANNESHEAIKERDAIDKKLDAKQRQEAQELSRKCYASDFTDC